MSGNERKQSWSGEKVQRRLGTSSSSQFGEPCVGKVSASKIRKRERKRFVFALIFQMNVDLCTYNVWAKLKNEVYFVGRKIITPDEIPRSRPRPGGFTGGKALDCDIFA